MTNVKVPRKDVISDSELELMEKKADQIQEPYFKLRAKAVLSLLETGKRRAELASLEVSDITEDQVFLYVRFTVVKKRKKSERTLQRTKKFSRDSKWAQYIRAYLDFLKREYPESKFVFPLGRFRFGSGYVVDPKQHIRPQEIWRIVKNLNPDDWPHQHRERRAVRVIRADEAKFGEAKLETVYRIRNVLDLEREQTAYNYIRRHETQKVEEEEETIA